MQKDRADQMISASTYSPHKAGGTRPPADASARAAVGPGLGYMGTKRGSLFGARLRQLGSSGALAAVATCALVAGCQPLRDEAQRSSAPTGSSQAVVTPRDDEGAPRPNILLLLADDLGYGEVGVYGQSVLATPNIDRLAAQGVRFARFYAGGPVCAPSRGSLMQGLHTGHIRNRGNYLREPFEREGIKVRVGLQEGDVTLAEVLQQAGYETAIFGKWHLEDHTDPLQVSWPHRQGFGESLVQIVELVENTFYPSNMYRDGENEAIEENADGARELYIDTLLSNEAIAFMQEERTSPFFLYVSFKTPHAPNEIASVDGYADEDWPDVEQRHAARVALLDRQVGRLVGALEAEGLAENTLVVFTSDNGPQLEDGHDPDFFDSNGSLRGTKGQLYEGGIRVPMIVSWPGVVQGGATTDVQGAFWDLLPTFADAARAPYDEGETDGISLVPVLQGEGLPRRPYLYWEHHDEAGSQAILADEWKLIRKNIFKPRDEIEYELYHLGDDPSEATNIAPSHPRVVRRLAETMEEAHAPSAEFPFPGED